MAVHSKCPKCGQWNLLDPGTVCEWHTCRRCRRRFVPVEDAGIQCPECGTLNMLPAKQARKGFYCISCGFSFTERGLLRSLLHLLRAPAAVDSLAAEHSFLRKWFYILPVAMALGALIVVFVEEMKQAKPGANKYSLARWMTGGQYKRRDASAISASILVGKPGASQYSPNRTQKPGAKPVKKIIITRGPLDYKNLGREEPAPMLRRIHRAQQAYHEKYGRYGSLELLVENGFLAEELCGGTYGIYEIDFPVFTSEKWCATLRPETSKYEITLAGSPLKYDRSYYIDQTGVVRSASYKNRSDPLAGPGSEPVIE